LIKRESVIAVKTFSLAVLFDFNLPSNYQVLVYFTCCLKSERSEKLRDCVSV